MISGVRHKRDQVILITDDWGCKHIVCLSVTVNLPHIDWFQRYTEVKIRKSDGDYTYLNTSAPVGKPCDPLQRNECQKDSLVSWIKDRGIVYRVNRESFTRKKEENLKWSARLRRGNNCVFSLFNFSANCLIERFVSTELTFISDSNIS